MEIIARNNKHLNKPKPIKKEYGCTCDNCGTVFIFKEKNIRRRLSEFAVLEYVKCPNCKQHIVTTKGFQEFKNQSQKEQFISQYRQDE